MPAIKSSAELINDYNGISQYCHTYLEPVFITKNGKGDLVVMGIETYEKLVARFELHDMLKEGVDDIEKGNVKPYSDAIADIKRNRNR